MIDLYDEEIVKVGKIMYDLQRKYGYRPNTRHTLELLEKEATGRFAEIGLIATVDIAPCLFGGPPTVTIQDRIEAINFDHEKHSFEVKEAHKRGEKYLDQRKMEE